MNYELQVLDFDRDKVTQESERVMKLLMTVNPQSPMYAQLSNMYNALMNREQELLMVDSIKNNTKSDTLEIGVTESVFQPDYQGQTILDAMVTEYTTITGVQHEQHPDGKNQSD